MTQPLQSSVAQALPPADPRLAATIRDAQIRAAVVGLVQHAQLALGDMQRLDESLYERFKSGEGRVVDDTSPDLLVRQLMLATFRGLRALVSYCHQLRPKVAGDAKGDGDFDFGDLEGSAPAGPGDDLDDLEAGDIGDLLDGFGEHRQRGEPERFQDLCEQLSSIEYGLSSQLEGAEDRVRMALSTHEIPQAIELLDDAANSTGEGVYALLATVYRTFVPEADPAKLAPGYLTTLQRALLVRRGLADLSRAVGPRNDALQAPQTGPTERLAALSGVRAALRAFVRSEAFKSMRPADRWQVASFERSVHQQGGRAAEQTCEGLTKYLESLSAINRREALVLHDQRALAELRETVATARQLCIIRPELAVDTVRRGLTAAWSLFGRDPTTDAVIDGLRRHPPRLREAAELERALQALEQVLSLAR